MAARSLIAVTARPGAGAAAGGQVKVASGVPVMRGQPSVNHAQTADSERDSELGLELRLGAGSATIRRWTDVPHKRLWRFTGADGAEVTCELEPLASNRVLLVVKRKGEPVVTETFADKRDALARSVGLYKEMKPAGDS